MLISNRESERVPELARQNRIFHLPSGSEDEGDLGLSWHVEVSGGLGLSLGVDLSLISSGVLFGVLLGVGSSSLSGLSSVLLGLLTLGFTESKELGVSGLLLENIFWDTLCPKTERKVMLVSHGTRSRCWLPPSLFCEMDHTTTSAERV